MFEQDQQWDASGQDAETLSQGLFGKVVIPPRPKKKTKLKKDADKNEVEEATSPIQKKKKLKKKKIPVERTGVKDKVDTGESVNCRPPKKRTRKVTTTPDISLSKKKKVTDDDSGDTESSKKKKRKKKRENEKGKENSRLGIDDSKELIGKNTDSVASSVDTKGAGQIEGSPKKKRIKHRKRKPKNKYAHLVKKKDPADVSAPGGQSAGLIGRGGEKAVGQNKTELDLASKPGTPLESKKKKKQKSKMENGAENTEAKSPVNQETGLVKKKKKRRSGVELDSGVEVDVGSVQMNSKVMAIRSNEPGSAFKLTQTDTSGAKKRKKKHEKGGDESGETSSKRQKISPGEAVATTGEPAGKPFSKSPFDLSELKKKLSAAPEAKGPQPSEVKKKGPLTLRERMMERLNSARFRDINEQLYKATGAEAYNLFEGDPSSFKIYHEGYQNQVSKWPVNPVDNMIAYIKSKAPNMAVADFGCGDAKIAKSVPNRVHSFDLVAVNEHITPCDMSKVPLKDKSVDIGIFCLSLMGTNLMEYLHEANRVMRKGGILLIAEVVSRIERLNIFIHQVEDLGFMLMHKDKPNKMFILFEFKKAQDAPPKRQLEPIELLPCLYKRR